VNNMKILLIGAAGSGKGTQATKLSEKYGIPHVSMGDLIRDEIKSESDAGKKIKEIVHAGKLIPYDLTVKILNKRLDQNDCKKGFILDGFPRTMEQEEMTKFDFDYAFYLEVSDKEVIERLLKRGRHDDTEDSIKERLNVFHTETKPLLAYFEEKGILKNVDGSASTEEVFENIVKVLE
jgi:adenylate kinase